MRHFLVHKARNGEISHGVVPEELRLWIDAQSLSEDASRKLGRNLNDIFPLERTKESRVVDAMWTRINDVGTFGKLYQ